MKKTAQQGISLIEIVIIITIAASLYGLATVSLTGFREKSALNSTVVGLITDIRSQQLKTMVGDSQGEANSLNFGVYFENNSYILFAGTTYSPFKTTNFSVNLEDNLQFEDILFPNSSIVFAKGSGEIVGFIDGQNSITLKNTRTNETKTIVVNRYGVITAVN